MYTNMYERGSITTDAITDEAVVSFEVTTEEAQLIDDWATPVVNADEILEILW
jgi:hypothetical protein